MSDINPSDKNITYQRALSPLGGSYTDNKLRRLALPPLSGLSFLDLGCNTGHYCKLALAQGATRVVGVDSDRNVIRKAREESPGIEFRDTGWDDFPAGAFDVVIFLSAIHYARDPCTIVDNIRHQLAPGGLFVLEGGLFFAGESKVSDTLFPSWRRVGDRCRHLSAGYVRSHLLRSFDWSVIGPSEPRGGDLVPRHVIHARPLTIKPRPVQYTLDVLEYFEAMRFSADTIVESQPAFNYVRSAGALTTVTANSVAPILENESNFNAFTEDLAFTLAGTQPLPVRILPSISEQNLRRIQSALTACGLTVLP